MSAELSHFVSVRWLVSSVAASEDVSRWKKLPQQVEQLNPEMVEVHKLWSTCLRIYK